MKLPSLYFLACLTVSDWTVVWNSWQREGRIKLAQVTWWARVTKTLCITFLLLFSIRDFLMLVGLATEDLTLPMSCGT